MNEIINGIIRANYHAGGIRILNPFRMDGDFMDQLERDVEAIVKENEPSDVTRGGHVTNWTRPKGEALQYSLFNQSGKTSDTADDHTRSSDGKKAIAYESIRTMVETLKPLGLMGMRLNYIGPRSGLSPHEEHIIHREGSACLVRLRFHLPVKTNESCFVGIDGHAFRMERGQVYFFNNGCVHDSQNEGESGRYHIVWDMMLTKKCLEGMFESVGIDDLFVANKNRAVMPIGVCNHKVFERYDAEVDTLEEALLKFAFAA